VRKKNHRASTEGSAIKTEYLVYAFLIGITLVIYGQVEGFSFLNYDDNLYVTDNEYVQAGLTLDGLRWAFTTGRASNWHPVTWLSHMLDVTWFGERSGAHHLVNVLLHVVAAVLLFRVLKNMTAALWPSALAAALFAVHPLHVESVAWVSERKDVLSAVFGLLTLSAYHAFVTRPRAGRYAVTLLLFSVGLMAKPMLVTLPAVLLLLDYWPLRRYTGSRPLAAQVLSRVAEKAPLLVLAAASCVVTYLVQRHGRSVVAMDVLPLTLRVENAVISYARYLLMTVWPRGLAVFYPHPGPALPGWQVVLALIVLAAITAVAVARARRSPYLLVGWLWYVGTLVPVIGLVQVGAQALADRYTYIPLIGVFIMAAWGAGDLGARARVPKPVLAVAAGIVVVLLAAGAAVQASYWRDSITLMEHALRVTGRNFLAHKNLGVALAEQKRYEEAIEQYRQGIAIKPNDPELYYNLANALDEMGRSDEAIAAYRKALEVKPDHAESHYNLGNTLARKGDYDGAIEHYRRVLEIDPGHLSARVNLGNALAAEKRFEEAVAEYRNGIAIHPNESDLFFNMGNALSEMGKGDEAIAQYRKALEINPENTGAREAINRLEAKRDARTSAAEGPYPPGGSTRK
jgi:Tfp pilus assembly protein PilF